MSSWAWETAIEAHAEGLTSTVADYDTRGHSKQCASVGEQIREPET